MYRRYEVTLRRWPAMLQRAMGCVHASLAVGKVHVAIDLLPSMTKASFVVDLPAGPAMLLTTLRQTSDQPAGGVAHGAYFVSVRAIDY